MMYFVVLTLPFFPIICYARRIFCFAYLVEGASGFGTPVALGAPMLVSTGHAAFPAVVVLLIMNTFATVWGAVGTPIWFGFGGLGLSEVEFLEISAKASIPLAVAAFILIPLTMMLLAPRSIVLHNWKFIVLSLLTCVGPSVGIAMVNYSFPSLMGGLIGCGLTAVLIRYKVGLVPLTEQQEQALVALQRGDDDQPSDVNNVDSIAADGSVQLKDIVTPGDRVDVVENDVDNMDVKGTTTNNKSTELHAEADSPIEMVASAQDADKQQQQQRRQADESRSNEPSADADNDPEDNEKNGDDAIKKQGNNNDDDVMRPFVRKESIALSDNGNSNNSKQPPARVISSIAHAKMMEDHLGPRKSWSEGYLRELIMRTFPIWAVVLILILTRIPQIGIKYYLTLREPYFAIYFGTYGEFRLSVSLVFQLRNILTYPGLNYRYELLYVPFLIPFVLVSLMTLFIYRRDLAQSPKQIAKTVVGRLTTPAVAMFGALSLVQLMLENGDASPANILGTILSKWFKQGFIVLSPLLGALGSFFSGSTTVSNLTFGDIQYIAAESINTSYTSMLALQAVGGSAGNGICLNNIIAACAVVGLDVGEGKILLQTYKFVFASTTISTIIMLAFFFRFG
jgi:L-lactate permease